MENLKNNVMEILIDMQYEGYELQDVITDVLNIYYATMLEKLINNFNFLYFIF